MQLLHLPLLLLLTSRPLPEAGAAFREGSSPQLAIDTRGTARMIFGRGDTIFAATSHDSGTTFGAAVVVGIVPGMHLGNTRGPVVASSRNLSLVSATDREGNTFLFQLEHRTSTWTRRARPLNSAAGSAPEGLASLAANDADAFYSVWLDYRDSKKTSIYFARIVGRDPGQPVNRRLYSSPDGNVCECCRPSVAVAGASVAVMFRNSHDGARDLYLMRSSDRGKSFGAAEKLGKGTWKIDACPMDGGAVAIDSTGRINTVWRRGLTVYHAAPTSVEVALGNGKNPMMSIRNGTTSVVWQEGADIKLQTLPGSSTSVVGQGRLPQVLSLGNGGALLAWEKDGKVYYKRT